MNEAENLKLAEWLEPLLKQKISRVNGEAFAGTLWTAGRGWDSQPSHDKFYPRYDFYEDEKANALLFEKLPEPSLRYYRYIREWGCLPKHADDMYNKAMACYEGRIAKATSGR